MNLCWTYQDVQQFYPQCRQWNGSAWQVATPPPRNGLDGLLGLTVAMNHAGTAGYAWTVSENNKPQQTAIWMPGWTDPQVVGTFNTGTVGDLDVDSKGDVDVTVSLLNPQVVQVERWNGTGFDAVFDGVSFASMNAVGNLALGRRTSPSSPSSTARPACRRSTS
jgi:hypothetical protein